ncbi:MAG TPA: SDR family NAD(P)-dependent oxidoreductase [Pseudonocardiaceae bacterium]|nr:SDR family NAD(P)-dependent oxidoreductase [Pseudonocardiaceae bacterium]
MTSSRKPLAVVTGASSGIGLELAKQFAANGFDLLIAAEEDAVHDAARTLSSHGVHVDAVQADLSTFNGVEQLVAAATANDRPVDALAVNAGIGVGGDFVRDTDLESNLKIVNLNCTSAVHLSKRLLPGMVERGRGRVLYTSSIAATGPGPYHAVYAASKAFLASFSEALREELKDTGVTVTALMPGPTDTRFFERAGMEDTKVASGHKDDPAEVAREGFQALMEGKDHVVAGSLRNKVQAAASRILPDPLKAKMQEKMTKPGSGDG